MTRLLLLISVTLTLVLALPARAEDFWAPKSTAKSKYVPPQRPHTKIAELKAKHQGEKAWRELIVDDKDLRSEYIYAAPGAKTPRAVHPDTRTWWVVLEGEVRFEIETVDPFVARKGSIVQAPKQTLFSYEVVGNQPALFFETNIAGARTLYPQQSDAPKLPGYDWMKVSFTRHPARWEQDNKPIVTFEELAKKVEAGGPGGSPVHDDRGVANFIYGYEKSLPSIASQGRGHYHPEGAEYWLIMSGQIRYAIEGLDVLIANTGDVVYVPAHTFHLARWYGPGPSTRLAMNGFSDIAHLFDPH
jgi:mannose-6-phosphate isomerase-like protein (cupin superfamily)